MLPPLASGNADARACGSGSGRAYLKARRAIPFVFFPAGLALRTCSEWETAGASDGRPLGDGGDAEGRPGLGCRSRLPLTRGGRGGAFTAFGALPHLPLITEF